MRQIQTLEQQYLSTMEEILEHGVDQGDRTGTGTREIFGTTLRADLNDGFPVLTTKKVLWAKAVGELAWMISGSTNVADLHASNIHIWDQWADEDGDLGPVYGAQWRSWGRSQVGYAGDDPLYVNGGIDQLADVVERIKYNPTCRRLIVSAWNVSQLDEMKLPPCHLYYQFNVQNGLLNCMMVQRSADWFIGVPFNIVQYAALTMLVAKITGLEPGTLTMNFGSAHLYKNHFEQAKKQLSHAPIRRSVKAFIGASVVSLDTVTPDFLTLDSYEHCGFIKAPISV